MGGIVSDIYQSIFSALGTAIGTLTTSKPIMLTSAEWDVLFEDARKQEVLALAFDGVNKSMNNLSLRQKTRWGMLSASLKHRSRHQKETINKLNSLLASGNIPMMLLKGYGFARFYPDPSLRESSDIDIYTFGHYEESNTFLQIHGIDIKSEDEKHCGFTYCGVEVENHLKMNYDLNHSNKVLAREFAARFDNDPETDSALEGVLLPEKNICALHLMMHTISHLAWSGITLRHLADWTMFLKHYGDSFNFEYLDTIWKESGLAPVVGMLTRICKEHLGCHSFPLDYDHLYREKDYEYLLWDILNPLTAPANIKGYWNKFRIKSNRYFRHRRKHKIIYGEPFPDGYLTDIGFLKKTAKTDNVQTRVQYQK